MAARSIASLTLSFGLVSIPVKVYSATESAGTVRFSLLSADGSRVKQQYVSERDKSVVVERSQMVKGYEFEKDRFVIFTPDELKALEESASHVIDIVAFIPERAVDPIYYDKAYFLAPDKRGGKPYTLLMEAMRASSRCALARWAWKSKQYVVQVRVAEDGLVLQQLLYADEVRSLADLAIDKVDVSDAELKLALQLIDQISRDSYDPAEFQDEEKKRVLAAIDEKIAGNRIVAAEPAEASAGGGQVIDLMEALRASLGGKAVAPAGKTAAAVVASPAPSTGKPKPAATATVAVAPAPAPRKVANGAAAAEVIPVGALKERKGVRRAEPTPEPVEAQPAIAPVRARSRK